MFDCIMMILVDKYIYREQLLGDFWKLIKFSLYIELLKVETPLCL